MKRKQISKAELASAYEAMTINEAMEHLGIASLKTFYKLLDASGIPRKEPEKGSPGPRRRYDLVD